MDFSLNMNSTEYGRTLYLLSSVFLQKQGFPGNLVGIEREGTLWKLLCQMMMQKIFPTSDYMGQE